MALPLKIEARPRDLWWFRKNVPCLDACPVKTDAGRYVQLIAEGRFDEAYRAARSPNPIASICGRTCGAPCEDACRRGKIDAPVTIRALKRFVAERFGPESLSSTSLSEILRGDMGGGSVTPGHGEVLATHKTGHGRRVAIVGAGPAGLGCANDLALMGYRVTVFEKMPLPGGMMRYGIPAYRLPREVIDYQAAEIESLGVEFRYGTEIGKALSLHDLNTQGYEAVFLAIGASLGRDLRIDGEQSEGVIRAIDYLLKVNCGHRSDLGKRVVVVGGGLVALDAARTAVRTMIPGLRMPVEEEAVVQQSILRVALDAAREAARRGALDVSVVSLESRAAMPATKSVQGREELEISADEGVKIVPSWGPKRIIATDGKVSAIEFVRCIRVFDDTGRFNPSFDENERLTLEADSVILAIGQAPDLSFLSREDGIEVTPNGSIRVDPVTLATSAPGIFVGGDGAFPPSLLITVAQHGKIAARSIDAFLQGKPTVPTAMHVTLEELPTDTYRRVEHYEQLPRELPILPLGRRTGIAEVETGFTAAEAQAQAQRCLYCHVHPIYDGSKCVLCNRCVDICPEHCLRFAPVDRIEGEPRSAALEEGPVTAFLYDEERCIRCGLCAIRCPTSAITMERFSFEERVDGG